MIKEWATVIRWHQGRALLRYGASSGCGSCSARGACGSYVLDKITPEIEHQLEISIDQPLEVGQKVEVGISEGSLLRSAMLVYLSPLLGLFLLAGILQANDFSQIWVFIGGMIGGIVGFLLAKKIAHFWAGEAAFEPVVLQIGLPPTELVTRTEC